LRDSLHDRQTQAGAAPISMRLSVGVEDSGQGIGGNTDASILHLKLQVGARISEAHEDTPAARSKPDRVGAKVNDELVQTPLVAEALEVRPVELVLQHDSCCLGLRVKLFDDAVNESGEVECLPLELHEPGAHARHFENLIGE